MKADWLAGPGTFWTLGLSGVGFGLGYVLFALRLGKVSHSEGDGCLLAICNLFLVIVGGAAGFMLFHFPTQLISSMVGAGLFPGIMTLVWVYRLEKR